MLRSGSYTARYSAYSAGRPCSSGQLIMRAETTTVFHSAALPMLSIEPTFSLKLIKVKCEEDGLMVAEGLEEEGQEGKLLGTLDLMVRSSTQPFPKTPINSPLQAATAKAGVGGSNAGMGTEQSCFESRSEEQGTRVEQGSRAIVAREGESSSQQDAHPSTSHFARMSPSWSALGMVETSNGIILGGDAESVKYVSSLANSLSRGQSQCRTSWEAGEGWGPAEGEGAFQGGGRGFRGTATQHGPAGSFATRFLHHIGSGDLQTSSTLPGGGPLRHPWRSPSSGLDEEVQLLEPHRCSSREQGVDRDPRRALSKEGGVAQPLDQYRRGRDGGGGQPQPTFSRLPVPGEGGGGMAQGAVWAAGGNRGSKHRVHSAGPVLFSTSPKLRGSSTAQVRGASATEVSVVSITSTPSPGGLVGPTTWTTPGNSSRSSSPIVSGVRTLAPIYQVC